MKNIITLLTIILIIISCKKEQKETKKEGFNLSVTAKNFPDSTKVILFNRDIDKNIDSTYVINESFKFSGNVDLPSLCYLFFYDLENKPIDHYKYLFIENKDISIVGEYSDFFNAKVSGSDQSDLLTKYYSISDASEKSKKASNQLDFLYANANNQMALNHLLYKKKEISTDSLLLFYQRLDSVNSNSPKGQELLAYSKIVQLKIGDKFRDIWGKDLNGTKHQLSDYHGKIILLDFWSPDCPYSSEQHKKELPQLVQKYNPEDFIIISYFIDTEAKDWKKLSEEDYSNWLHISDLQGMKGENISEYDITGTPNSFLIDKNGIVVKSFVGFYEGEHRIENEINKLMN
ncbi:MAG: DUF4369 domain-containing protein [Gelidibacter sp.]|uniref:TlpA disulfide reductase family protein n=1 Tax=Gelidibacter sp. TaxID=2018083 RepID=UPI003264F2C5